MPLLQVRDCPEDIYKKIARVAKRQNRTIAQQTIVLLEKSLGQELSNLERRKQLLERIQNRQILKAVKNIDVITFIREDRNR
jgi:predicted nuclease of restriction endonuclease-like RecB superfamily